MVGRRQIIIKRNLDQNINDSKSHIWNSFFENIISGIQRFYICPDFPLDVIGVFFFLPDFLAESLKAKKS